MNHFPEDWDYSSLASVRQQRAQAIAQAGGLEAAIGSGAIRSKLDLTVSEALVLGLMRQQVCSYISVFGHGSTDVGEVLRIFEAAGLVKTYGVRSEIEASHAAAALRWVTGEKAAVVTSIGPGALQALAASIVPASDGLGVWYLFGDETTQDEGPNMQQIPKPQQSLFLQLGAAMGSAYQLHTPQALGAALHRGLVAVDHPHRPGPFYLLLPMNVQPAVIKGFNLSELPRSGMPALGAAADDGVYERAAEHLRTAQRIVVKAGGGARFAGREIEEFLELVDGVAVLSPLVSGLIPFEAARNMLVGGSKGAICGNFAMEEADLAVVIGSRFVCQSDCSRTGYLKAKHAIVINSDFHDATHYNNAIALLGDAGATLRKLNQVLRRETSIRPASPSRWLLECQAKRREWEDYKRERYEHPVLFDSEWAREVLTQPAVIKTATDWAREQGVVCFFDAGDVQANGFQIVEDDRLGRTFTETGASYMGFAVSALLATAVATKPFYALALTGDGAFTMNPQVLIDGAAHGVRGCILLLDNRRMAAISGLQKAQYQAEYATADHVPVDYVSLAAAVKGVAAFHGGYAVDSLHQALEQAFAHPGLALIHVPVYYGDDPLGGLGAFGRWNVGNWVQATQELRHSLEL